MRHLLTRPSPYTLPAPLDEVELANALVLKNPPLALLDTREAPNFVKCMHGDLLKQLNTTVLLPNLHSSRFIGIFSDYAGDERDCDYHTYSFLFVALDGAQTFLDKLTDIRAQHGLVFPSREMAFKNLGYGPAERALPQWLAAVDDVPGFLFTLLVDKRAKSVVTRNSTEALRTLVAEMRARKQGTWRKPHVAERFLRIAHCVAYWCSVLCRPDHQIIWISDNDCVAERSLSDTLRHVTMSAAADYRSDLRATFSFGPESELSGTFREYREFLSYPDLVSGSLGNTVTRALPAGASFGVRPVPRVPGLKPKAVEVLRWLSWQRIALKKALFLCRQEAPGLRGAFGRIDHDDIPEEVRFVPILRDDTSSTIPFRPVAAPASGER